MGSFVTDDVILAIERADGRTHVNPSADTILRSGDRVRVFGLPKQVRTFGAAGRDRSEPAPEEETHQPQGMPALEPGTADRLDSSSGGDEKAGGRTS
jgi:hypothetical protein